MFEYERSLFVRMTVKADTVPGSGRSQFFSEETAMGIVTIRALEKSFFDPMVRRQVELCLHLLMTPVTEIRL